MDIPKSRSRKPPPDVGKSPYLRLDGASRQEKKGELSLAIQNDYWLRKRAFSGSEVVCAGETPANRAEPCAIGKSKRPTGADFDQTRGSADWERRLAARELTFPARLIVSVPFPPALL